VVSTGEGGDTPGVNAAIRAVVRSIIRKGGEAWVVEEGFSGLLGAGARKFKQVDRSFVAGILESVCTR
jgi:6-phosphofructokinase 1